MQKPIYYKISPLTHKLLQDMVETDVKKRVDWDKLFITVDLIKEQFNASKLKLLERSSSNNVMREINSNLLVSKRKSEKYINVP